jgi:hypothetical protein
LAGAAVVGVGVGALINTIPGVSEALTFDFLSEPMSDTMVAMSKQTGRQIPTDLIPLTPEQLLEERAKETAKGRGKSKKRLKDIDKALKEKDERNKGKARGGRREGKKSKKSPEAN